MVVSCTVKESVDRRSNLSSARQASNKQNEADNQSWLTFPTTNKLKLIHQCSNDTLRTNKLHTQDINSYFYKIVAWFFQMSQLLGSNRSIRNSWQFWRMFGIFYLDPPHCGLFNRRGMLKLQCHARFSTYGTAASLLALCQSRPRTHSGNVQGYSHLIAYK